MNNQHAADSHAYFADHAWLPQGWEDDVRLEVDFGRYQVGHILSVAPDTPKAPADYLGRFVLPGMPNLHSHAFQRAMAGLAERQTHDTDSFWTWREVMYSCAASIGPEELQAIAAQLYVEMLKVGFTHVCEFHYLHHDPHGKPYADPATMSLALLAAAREAGIGITLLPTLYMTGGFDGRALSERQRRFGHSVDSFLDLLCKLRKLEDAQTRIGVALHSLRAVPADAMRAVLAAEPARSGPIHIHIAEQIGEVQDCLNLRNARPVEWLLAHAPVDARWCLVHATHINEDEIRRVAASGAVIGLCPTTEANLGDGLFPLRAYMDNDGAFGIGSDSHISVSAIEELRWLEYGQRLITRHRNIATSDLTGSVGESLWGDTLYGGALACGAAVGELRGDDAEQPLLGARADWLVLDDNAPIMAGRDISNALDTLIFAGNRSLFRHVMVGGRWVVRDFHHFDEERIALRYRKVAERLGR